jgi:pyruvate dehydrogenase E2 component (dihydrolipoamide acetyltransferase)
MDVQSDRYEVQPLSAARRVTAERLAQAKQTIPHFYLRIDCNMDHVARVRQELAARGDEKFPLTAFTIRAAALALQRVPGANSAWVDGTVRVYKTADIAVAVNTRSGLIAPIVRQAEQKSLRIIAREVEALAARARDGRLKPEDYSGGTFTISNLGMYGVTSLYPIINPPQSCILGIGALEERPVVRDHALAVGAVMTCTLSADHRAVDGVAGAEFLAAFRQLIEDPWALFL